MVGSGCACARLVARATHQRLARAPLAPPDQALAHVLGRGLALEAEHLARLMKGALEGPDGVPPSAQAAELRHEQRRLGRGADVGDRGAVPH